MVNLSGDELLTAAKGIEPWVVGIRRRLHQCPELMYELHETSKIVQEELTRLQIPFEAGIAETGILATLGTGQGNCVLLRADMDALPIEEQADIDFKSRNPGKMHACGHDCHTAMLLGAARLLKEHEAELPGTVKLCFQPAEEGGAGGRRMCDAGIMRQPTVNRAFALHVWPQTPSGQLTSCPGTFLAAVSSIEITIVGVGGHAAAPHLNVDPICCAAKLITSAQTLISRELNPMEAGVVSFTQIEGGSTHNVIPPQVTIKGTIRSLTTAGKDRLKARLSEMAGLVAAADRCTATLATIGEDYPETANDPGLWAEVHAMGERFVGAGNFPLSHPIMGGEDFSFYGAYAPTCFIGLGCRDESQGCTYGVHHPRFKMDESVLHLGTALHVAFVLEHL